MDLLWQLKPSFIHYSSLIVQIIPVVHVANQQRFQEWACFFCDLQPVEVGFLHVTGMADPVAALVEMGFPPEKW